MVTLRTHQVEGVNHILAAHLVRRAKAFLLADETGLGKTYTSIFAVRQLAEIWPEASILVVCPLSVIEYWEECFAETSTLNVKVLNYQKLKRLFLVKKSIIAKKKVSKYELVDGYDFIIFDEAHQMRGYSSVCQKLGLMLMERSRFTLLLTATPAQSPLEMGYLKTILGFNDFFSWIFHEGFSISKHPILGHLVWKYNTPDVQKVAARIYPEFGIRRRAQDLVGWPEQQVEPWAITLTPAQRALYAAAVEEYIVKLITNGRSMKSIEEYIDLVSIGVLRQKVSSLKVDSTVQFTNDLLEEGKQVAIYAAYLDTIKQLKHKFGDTALVLTGDTPAHERAGIIKQFSNGTRPVILFTIHQSINLQQPTEEHPVRVQINHDVPWSGIMATQLNGRCHRDGKHALIYNMYAKGTIDEAASRKMTERCKALSQLSGDVEYDVTRDAVKETFKLGV